MYVFEVLSTYLSDGKFSREFSVRKARCPHHLTFLIAKKCRDDQVKSLRWHLHQAKINETDAFRLLHKQKSLFAALYIESCSEQTFVKKKSGRMNHRGCYLLAISATA